MSSLGIALSQWLEDHPRWSMRSDLALATYQEIAQRLLDDPRVRAELVALGKVPRQGITEAVAEQGLPVAEAELLETTLDIAATTALGPVWRREEVHLVVGLVGVGLIILWVTRHRDAAPSRSRGLRSEQLPSLTAMQCNRRPLLGASAGPKIPLVRREKQR